VSQCATAEEFVASFHPYLERDSLFIATGNPEEPGQAVRFVMTLAGGETVLRGIGRVVECHRDRGNFYGLRGMKLQFDDLDDGSRRALAALETRAGGRQGRAAAGGHRPSDMIECLIYDEPDAEAADPASMSNSRRPRATAERGLPPAGAGDDDVTAVAPPPRPPRTAGHGTGPVPRQPPPARMARASAAPPPAPGSDHHGMSFSVPRPRSDPGAEPAAAHGRPREVAHEGSGPRPSHASGHQHAHHQAHHPHQPSMRSASGRMPATSAAEASDLPTDILRAGPPPVASMPVSPPRGTTIPTAPVMSPQGAGSGPLVDYDHTDLGLGTSPPHRPPPELSSFPPGEYAPVPPTRPGGRGPVPRPPLPSERTEIVRVVRRPSTTRNVLLGVLLGTVVGLGAGYVLWGLDHAAFGVLTSEEPAAKAQEPAPTAKPTPNAKSKRPDDSADEAVETAPAPTRVPADGEAAVEPAAAPAASTAADAGADDSPTAAER
jgi:hypothetical protein